MAEQPKPAGAVFISYASQDGEAAARICETLRAAGIEVWFDMSELRGGDVWDSKIKKQIHNCTLFVPVISANTNARSEGYFRREWNLATRRLLDMAQDTPFFVPVVIDGTREADARVPEEFLRAQWTRLPAGVTSSAFAHRVRQLLMGATEATPGTAAMEIIPSSAPSKVSSRPEAAIQARRIGFALIALLLALGGGVVWYYQGPNSWRDSARENFADQAATGSAVQAGDLADVPSISERTIAVLPFVNMSSDKEQEYFSDGLSEEVMNLLANIPDLRVAARTSSFFFKGKNVKLPDVARELQVAHLLEGSVRKSGNRVRITAQLIRGSDGFHQWSETYDRTLDDIFAVQEEIAAAVVSQLKVTLLSKVPTVRRTSPQAYALYLQALQLDREHTGRFDESIALYQKSLTVDPDYTPAWVGLGTNHALRAITGVGPLADGMEKARESYRKALAIDPQYGLAYAGLGWLAVLYDDDLAAAARHFDRALALDSTDPDILGMASTLSRALGRTEQQVRLLEYLVGRDPMDPFSHLYLGAAYLRAGQLEESMASGRAALKLSPTMLSAHELIGDALYLNGDYKAALAEFENEPSEVGRLSGMAGAHYGLGNKSESDVALHELIEKYADQPASIAFVFSERGEIDRAFEWLQKAVALRDPSIANAANVTWLRNLHDDRRWLPFLRKIGKAPEQLAAIKFELTVPHH